MVGKELILFATQGVLNLRPCVQLTIFKDIEFLSGLGINGYINGGHTYDSGKWNDWKEHLYFSSEERSKFAALYEMEYDDNFQEDDFYEKLCRHRLVTLMILWIKDGYLDNLEEQQQFRASYDGEFRKRLPKIPDIETFIVNVDRDDLFDTYVSARPNRKTPLIHKITKSGNKKLKDHVKKVM
jgi:hypothetical protein